MRRDRMPGSDALATVMQVVKTLASAAIPCLSMLSGAAAHAQEEAQREELALRSDTDWTELVVVLRSGKRVACPRSDVLKVEDVMPRAGSGSGPAAVVARLTRGRTMECSAQAGAKTYPCKVRITGFNRPSGAIAGELTWPTVSSVHRIRGKLQGNSLSFTETEAIRAGGAHLNVDYTLTISGSALTGGWVDRSDHDARGTYAIEVP